MAGFFAPLEGLGSRQLCWHFSAHIGESKKCYFGKKHSPSRARGKLFLWILQRNDAVFGEIFFNRVKKFLAPYLWRNGACRLNFNGFGMVRAQNFWSNEWTRTHNARASLQSSRPRDVNAWGEVIDPVNRLLIDSLTPISGSARLWPQILAKFPPGPLLFMPFIVQTLLKFMLARLSGFPHQSVRPIDFSSTWLAPELLESFMGRWPFNANFLWVFGITASR